VSRYVVIQGELPGADSARFSTLNYYRKLESKIFRKCTFLA
jgi:hypothetical protein